MAWPITLMRTMKLVYLALSALVLSLSTRAQPLDTVVAAYKDPNQEWKNYPTRTLENLPSAVREKVDAGLTPYGGLVTDNNEPTGFFRTKKLNGRWWLVDPAGGLYLYKGVASVSQLRTSGATAAFQAKFGNTTNWAVQTTAFLREHG